MLSAPVDWKQLAIKCSLQCLNSSASRSGEPKELRKVPSCLHPKTRPKLMTGYPQEMQKRTRKEQGNIEGGGGGEAGPVARPDHDL